MASPELKASIVGLPTIRNENCYEHAFGRRSDGPVGAPWALLLPAVLRFLKPFATIGSCFGLSSSTSAPVNAGKREKRICVDWTMGAQEGRSKELSQHRRGDRIRIAKNPNVPSALLPS